MSPGASERVRFPPFEAVAALTTNVEVEDPEAGNPEAEDPEATGMGELLVWKRAR